MSSSFYPASPKNVPSDLTKAKASYKRQAWLAMMGLVFFMIIYFALLACFAWIAYSGFTSYQEDLFSLIIPVMSGMLALFMAKSLFAIRKAGDPHGIEVTPEQEPELYSFLHELADEVGAPRPHRVFITPEVNAAVFYDLSLMNLLFPSKKNLIIGLGLVNVLNLGELKAVLAHEFGHFAQGSMMVGRWVYTAQQIISHMVSVRDWFDSIISFISRIDLRIAWLGWILSIIVWSLRSIMDTLFNIVIIAERALSREMEFNADLVAVSVTGSDALVNALYKLQAADHAWQTALEVLSSEAKQGRIIDNVFDAQNAALGQMRRILDDENYGIPAKNLTNEASHRVFANQSARPPQMWSTHPPSSDREDNAKHNYIQAAIDERDAWVVFSQPDELKKAISLSYFNEDALKELEASSSVEAVSQRFSHIAYSPEFRGAYLQRSPVRSFKTVDDMFSLSNLSGDVNHDMKSLYPDSIKDELELLRDLEIEKSTLEALASGELKPSGGVIRHRGEELDSEDIPQTIEDIGDEIQAVSEKLMQHDANCRTLHVMLAKQNSDAWENYLKNLVELLHCSEHMAAVIDNEHALLANTWQVITADDRVGFFEKRRMIKVCQSVQEKVREVSNSMLEIELSSVMRDELNIEKWRDQCPVFDLVDVDKKNWGEWVSAASESMGNMSYALNLLRSEALEQMIKTETLLSQSVETSDDISEAPPAGKTPKAYPVLMPGDEHVLQKKLDLWNRFQLAQGTGPTLMHLLVSVGIVGGTIYGGVIGF